MPKDGAESGYIVKFFSFCKSSYEVKRSQRFLLAAIEKNQLDSSYKKKYKLKIQIKSK